MLFLNDEDCVLLRKSCTAILNSKLGDTASCCY